MILKDFHVHTCYCDGKDTPEDIVLEAISRGMEKLGFSGHSYTPFDEEPCMSLNGTREYKREIKRLKRKYESQIKILLGTEQDYYSEMKTSDYDYVIGSVHYVKCGDEFGHIDHSPEMLADMIRKYFNSDPYAFAERYFFLVADVINRTHADIIGHFDLLTKFNEDGKFFDENNKRYISAANSALDTLLKTGKPFEINTGAISRGYRTFPYPGRSILEYIAEHNGSVILSSDSHQKETLMYKFDECEKLVNELGLKLITL